MAGVRSQTTVCVLTPVIVAGDSNVRQGSNGVTIMANEERKSGNPSKQGQQNDKDRQSEQQNQGGSKQGGQQNPQRSGGGQQGGGTGGAQGGGQRTGH